MKCHRVKRSGKPAGRLHSLFCAECRASQRTDDLLAFGIVQLRKPAHTHMAMNRTLDALNLSPIPANHYQDRNRRRRTTLRAASIAALLLGVGGWVRYMDWVPAEAAVSAWEQPSHSYLALSAAIASSTPPVRSMSSANPIVAAVKRLDDPKESSHGPDLAVVGRYVSDHAETLKMIHENKFLPYREQMDRTWHGSAYPYSYLTLYSGISMLHAELASKVATGDRTGAIEDALDMIAFGENASGGGSWSARCYGVQCQQDGRLHLWSVLSTLTADEARRACTRLTEARKLHKSVGETMRWEREADLYVRRTMLRTPFWRWQYADVFARSNSYPTSILERLRVTVKLYARSNRRILQEERHAFDVAESQFPLYAQNAYGVATQERQDAIDQELIPNETQFYTNMRFMDTESETQNALLVTALAIRAYHVEHGANPKSLQALCPTYLDQVPTDAFVTGSPLHYSPVVEQFCAYSESVRFAPGRTAKDGSVTFPTYLLYSDGPDECNQKGTFILPPSHNGSKSLSEQLRVRQDSFGDIVAGVNL